MGKAKQLAKVLGSLEGFTTKENWDRFFIAIQDGNYAFEWYEDWPELQGPLLSNLPKPESQTLPLQLLVPGCGTSHLSEHLYDAGFKAITNIDLSEVAISDMLRRNARIRPGMKWQVMDVTAMQFEDESFDVVVDKGGLDALMDPEFGVQMGNQYLQEVNRVLKFGGKFICFTWAWSDVLGSLFSTFRLGWKMSFHAIPLNLSTKPKGHNLQTFMMVAEKEMPTALHQIAISSLKTASHENQGCSFQLEAFETENRIRRECSTSGTTGSDVALRA
ncbi:hypothetical protein C1H46_010895 [Malus baccata]|uniref:Methyltransferase type 11 domain-containing protein n=1 Tax=Malus baccata TaxID=106549 RepID=A0A540MZ09_MALBA|nr:hypothetical protein C1H46_010895 [Malus baccata]